MSGLGAVERRQLWPALLGVGILLVGVLGAYLMTRSPGSEDSSSPQRARPSARTGMPSEAASTDQKSTSDATGEGLEVLRWGGHGDQLAILVRNPSDLTVRRAEVLITAQGADGAPIAVASGSPQSTCCTVLGLPAGASYGLFVDLDGSVEEVDRVSVRYLEARFIDPRTQGEGEPPRIEVDNPRLRRLPHDAEVLADLTAVGDVRGVVVGQALLAAPDGEVVGVISGRFYCFTDGATRSVRMQLLRPVPPGTRIDRVLAYPIPAGERAGKNDACRSDRETR